MMTSLLLNKEHFFAISRPKLLRVPTVSYIVHVDLKDRKSLKKSIRAFPKKTALNILQQKI